MLRVGVAVEEERSFGSSLGPPIYLSNLTRTSDSTRIVSRAREYGKTSEGVIGKYSLRVPSVVLLAADGFVFWNSVTVPVDGDLNLLARRMIEHPSSVVPVSRKPNETEIYQIRISGVDALQHFETKSNVKLFRSLLAEPFVEISRAPPRYETVSARAFEALLGWGRDDGSIPVSADKIESLQLVGKNISDETIETLARLSNLKELTITDSSLTTTGYAKLIDFERIELVNVDHRLLSDELMRMLRLRKKFYKTNWANANQDNQPRSDDEISMMMINGSQAITDAAIDELIELKDQLSTIYLHETSITDKGLLKLHNFKSLTGITVTDTKVTKTGVEKLQKALPKCSISSAFTNTIPGK